MRPILRGYALAVLEEAAGDGSLASTASELDAVEGLVARDPALSAALTDVGVPVRARRGVLDELLRPRVGAHTLRIVLKAAEVESAPELLVGLHDAAELARLLNERPSEVDIEGPTLGRSAQRDLLAGYAGALFETVEVAEIESVEDDLFRLARIVESNPELRVVLGDRSVVLASRQGLLRRLLEGKARPLTVRLAAEALRGKVRDVVGELDWLVEVAARARGWRVARVRAAREVPEDEQQRLGEAMEHLTGLPVELQVTLDASLLGGAVVQVGDLLVDATASHRLAQLEERLAGEAGGQGLLESTE